LGSKADMLLRPQNDTRMNDQSVGSIADAILRFQSITF
jgi:hypothetical protein